MRRIYWKYCKLGLLSLAWLAALPIVPATAQAQKGATKAGQEKRTKAFAGQATIQQSRKASVPFRKPDELRHRDFNELTINTGTFPNGHRADVTAPDAFELLCYNGQAVGPTIRVRRGKTFHIHLKNDLDTTVDSKPNPPNPPTGGFPSNPGAQPPHDLCTTNLHTHGLHVSPANNADNILGVEVGPKGSGKEEFTFEYTIPVDHPSGTFWYHPHHHGSVAYQLSNGLSGALIVEGEPGDPIPDLDDVPEIAAAKERIFVFELYNFR